MNIYRVGKTKRDMQNGAKHRNANNKAERAAWQKSSNASQSNFPFKTCNGKRNRCMNRYGSVFTTIKGM